MEHSILSYIESGAVGVQKTETTNKMAYFYFIYFLNIYTHII